MTSAFRSRYTAFASDKLVARGAYGDIAQALAAAALQGPVFVFDDQTGAPVDTPPRPEHAALLAQLAEPVSATQLPGQDAPDAAPDVPAPRAAPGRPKLGVVAREVTLLPRHWDWLAGQSGGASAALRRLVEQARKSSENADMRRQTGERSYKLMSAIAGHRAEFEEAARALFAGDHARFSRCTARWPHDVRTHLAQLAQGAFAPAADAKESP